MKTTLYLNRIDELDRIVQDTKLNRSEVVDELIRAYGDKLRTQYNRRKLHVSDDDFQDSPQVAETRSLLKRICPWM